MDALSVGEQVEVATVRIAVEGPHGRVKPRDVPICKSCRRIDYGVTVYQARVRGCICSTCRSPNAAVRHRRIDKYQERAAQRLPLFDDTECDSQEDRPCQDDEGRICRRD